jgi:hypothetical protein
MDKKAVVEPMAFINSKAIHAQTSIQMNATIMNLEG